MSPQAERSEHWSDKSFFMDKRDRYLGPGDGVTETVLNSFTQDLAVLPGSGSGWGRFLQL
jgi:hypothetical protein